jgi:hypothetical protein
MANAFLANLGHLIFKIFGGGGLGGSAPPPLVVPFLASVFSLGSDWLVLCYIPKGIKILSTLK